jgi:hypothetical protein
MYYPDLSPYVYLGSERNTFNVGWLDNAHPYPTGEVPELFVKRLFTCLTITVKPTLGAHRCDLCNGESWGEEIRVFGQGEIVYAAPTMIYHYVVDHHYRPPEEFIQAVLDGPLADTEEYRQRAQTYPWAEDVEGYYEWLARRDEPEGPNFLDEMLGS